MRDVEIHGGGTSRPPTQPPSAPGAKLEEFEAERGQLGAPDGEG